MNDDDDYIFKKGKKDDSFIGSSAVTFLMNKI